MRVVSTDIGGSEPAFLQLVYSASERYNDFVYRSPDLASQVQRYLFDQRACEFAPPHVWIVREGNELLGMIAALSGDDLQRCRLRAALAIAKSTVLRDHPAISRRLQLASQALLRVRSSDFYISLLAVHTAARNQGIGKFLLEHVEREARGRSFTRMVLEASPLNTAAVRLCRRQSYRVFESRRVTDPDGAASLELLHMAKDLPLERGTAPFTTPR